MLKSILALLTVAALAVPGFAEESEMQNRDRRPGGRQGGQWRRGGMPGIGRGGSSMLQRFKAEKDIAAKYPEEFAKIEKQLFEAEQKLNELAQKAKVTLPGSIESKIRTLKHKQPQAFDELLKTEDPREAAGKLMKLAKENDVELFPAGMMRGRRRDRGEEGQARPERNNMRRPAKINFAKLRKLYPEEMAKIEALRESDPAAFRAGVRELTKQMNSKKAQTQKAE